MALFKDSLLHGMTIRESATDGSDFTNPAADYRRLYLGEDGQLHVKDSAGAVTDIGSGASGILATIFDAKGDIIAATAADTAARLAVGTNGYILAADSGTSTGLRWREHRICRKTADEALSSTSYANSTNMGLAISASKVYKFRYIIFYTTNATSVGIKLAIQGPASCLAFLNVFGGFSVGSISAAASIISNVQASADISTDLPFMEPATGPGGTATGVIVEGTVVNSTNAGTLQLRHASETATATTILQQSHGELLEVI